MRVLIKDMEMPHNCCGCEFLDFTPTWTTPFCRRTGKDLAANVYFNKRDSECPLVPVPPHGRLGDLDALAKQIEHERFHHTHTDGLAARHHVAEYGHFLKAISDAPTIIPAEEAEA